MANDYRNESRRQPPLERFGTPGTRYPTPNPFDVVITEEADIRAQVFEPILFGTPHPVVAEARLCYQGPVKGSNQDKAPIRIYANPRLAQEPYNVINGDDEANDSDFPKLIRSYLLPRGYAKATKAQPLTALIGLTLNSGGSGYGADLLTPGFGRIALAFSGGSGSGAAGFAEVVGGVIVAVLLTNSGTGYTGTPTVTASGGTGVSITALRQPATLLLSDEIEEPAEEPFGGYFVRVTRTYETINGRLLTGRTMAGEAQGELATTSTQLLAAGEPDLEPNFKTLSYSDTPRDAHTKRRDILFLNEETDFPVLTDYDQDPEHQSLITTTFKVVDASAVVAPTVVQGVITRFKHIDKWRSLKIVETIAAPASYSEQKFAGQSFPALLAAFYHSDPCGTFLLQRGSFSAMVKIRLDISFGDFEEVDGLTLIPNTFALGSFRVSDVLNDAGTIESSEPDCSFTMDLPASTPSKSTYEAFGSTLQLVSGESVLWKAGYFRTTKLYVAMIQWPTGPS